MDSAWSVQLSALAEHLPVNWGQQVVLKLPHYCINIIGTAEKTDLHGICQQFHGRVGGVRIIVEHTADGAGIDKVGFVDFFVERGV